MSLLTSILYDFSAFLRSHLTFIASAYIATILVIYGDRLNKIVWVLVKGAHFIVRTMVFVALCAVCYGAFAMYLVPWLKSILLIAGSLWLGPVVVVLFFILGYLAERNSRKG